MKLTNNISQIIALFLILTIIVGVVSAMEISVLAADEINVSTNGITPNWDSPEYADWKQSLAESLVPDVRSLRLGGATSVPLKVGNTFIEYYADADYYSIGMTGGNTNTAVDDNARMMYGHPGGSTSNTIFNIDGINYTVTFNSHTYDEETKALVSSGYVTGKNICVERTLSLFYNPISEVADTVRISFRIINETGASLPIGCRIMWDTMLGNRDDAPFRVAGIGAIRNEKELSESEIPDSWLVIDNIDNPGVVTTGYPKNIEGLPQPDRLQFVSWGNVSNISSAWTYVPNNSRNIGDSAVCIYWDPKALASGSSIEYATYYGIGSFVQNSTGGLVSGADPGVYQLKRQPNGGYTPNEFTVTAFLENGGTSLTNVKAKLSLPNGLLFADGSTSQEINIASLAANENRSDLFWKVRVSQTVYFPFDTPIQMLLEITADQAQVNRSIPLIITIPEMDVALPYSIINLTAESARRQVTLNWDDPLSHGQLDVVGYKIFRNNELIATINMDDPENNPITSYEDFGSDGTADNPKLARNTQYTYKVYALNFRGDMSSMPATVTVTTLNIDDEGPSAPTELRITSFDQNSFKLNWNAALDESDISKYTIYRDGNYLADIDGSETYYTVISPEALTVASYTVESYDNSTFVSGGNKSTMSENLMVGVDTLFQEIENGSRPRKIENFSAVGTLYGISLSWSISSEVGTTYLIYRRSEVTGYSLLATISNRNTLSYLDATTENDTTYHYYIVGVNSSSAFGASSDVVSAKKANDEENPIVTKLTPQNSSYINGTVTFTATAQDNDVVTRVDIFYSLDNGGNWTQFASCLSFPYNETLDTTAFADGTIRIKAVAYDARNNESDPLIYIYSIDNTGPEQVAGLAYSSTSVTITLSWNDVSDDDISYFRVELKNTDGTYIKIADITNALGANILNLTPNTVYTYRIVGYDRLGNRGVPSNDLVVMTQVDSTAPVITVLQPRPTNNATSYYSDSVQFSATADDDYAIKTIETQISFDRINWTTVNIANYSDILKKRTSTFMIDLTIYAEGTIYARAVAADFNGNVSDVTSNAPFVQYIIDRTPPTAPTGVQAFGRNGVIEIAWEKGLESDLGKYSVYRSTQQDTGYARIATALTTLNFIDRNVNEAQTYYYKVSVNDLAGNESDMSDIVSTEVLSDDENPVIVNVYPPENDTIGTSYRTISIYATDNHMLDTIKVEYKKAGAEYSILTIFDSINAFEKTVSVTIPLDGFVHNDTIMIRVVAVDKSGNISVAREVSYTVDKQAPSALNPSAQYNNDSVIVTWQSNLEDDLIGYRIYRKTAIGSYSLVGSQSATANKTAYSFTDYSIALAKETYTYRIDAVDNCENIGSVYTNAIETPDRSAPTAIISCDSVMEVGVQYEIDASQSTDNSGIVSYAFDFGDGTISTNRRVIHTYAQTGTYTITLTVTDGDGNTGSTSKEISVRERAAIGTAEIRIVDEDGKVVPNAPVYFDLGEDNQVIRITDGRGIATFSANAGKHTVGCIIADNNWLPVKKDIIVAAGEKTSVTMTLIHHIMIEGVFEIKRMIFEEIVAAGIDVSKPENQHIANITLTLTYGVEQLKTTFTYNGITGQTSARPQIVTTASGEKREIIPVIIAPKNVDTTVANFENQLSFVTVAILDIPVGISYLKEFFDVNLTIINNASSDFYMKDNQITLNLPDGLSIVGTSTTERNRVVFIPKIFGQTEKKITWILRGDEAGEYPISADYIGTLSEFNEEIVAKFISETPIKVYGEDGVKFILEYEDTVDDGDIYFNIGFFNDCDDDSAYVDLLSFDISGITPYAIKKSTNIDSYNDDEWNIDEWRSRSEWDNLSDSIKVNPGEIYWQYYGVPIEALATYINEDLAWDSDSEAIGSTLLDFMTKIQIDNGFNIPTIVASIGTKKRANVKFPAYGMDDTKEDRGKWEVSYSDSFFRNDSFKYNHIFGKMSLALALAGFSSVDESPVPFGDNNLKLFEKTDDGRIYDNTIVKYDPKYTDAKMRIRNIVQLYNELEFTNTEYYNYGRSLHDGIPDEVAFSIAEKQIVVAGEEQTLIALVIRGGGYGTEWGSNFNIGDVNDVGHTVGRYHYAFDVSAAEVLTSLKDYIIDKKIDITLMNIWITGYSRGAAVSDLVAARISDEFGQNKVYAYTFATPQGVRVPIIDNNYKNIFCIVNPNDLIPRVAFSNLGWNFGRYGIEKQLPSSLTNIDYIVKFAKVGSALMDLRKKEGVDSGKIIAEDFYVDPFQELSQAKLIKILTTAFPTAEYYSVLAQSVVAELVATTLGDKTSGGGVGLWDSILWLLNTPGISFSILDALSTPIRTSGAIAYGAYGISPNHYPELYISWMDNFSSEELFSGNKYKLISFVIKKAYNSLQTYDVEEEVYDVEADIYVYTKSGELVLSIVDGQVMEQKIAASIDDGFFNIYLPGDADFDIRMIFKDDGILNYSISEVKDGLISRTVMQNNVFVQKGQITESGILGEQGIDVSEYAIYIDGVLTESPIINDSDTEEIEMVTIECDIEGIGYVDGSGDVYVGQYISLLAIGETEDSFLGWYENGVFLTSEKKYSFTADQNRSLVAKFGTAILNSDITAAKSTIEGAFPATTTQAIANSEANAEYRVEQIITSLSLNGVTPTVNKVSYTAAVAGTVSNAYGTNGSYVFTVSLNKGSGTAQTTAQLTLTITATAYNSTDDDDSDITVAKSTIEGAFPATTTQAIANSEANAEYRVEQIITSLSLNGVTPMVNRVSYTEAVAGTVNNAYGTNGSYVFTVSLNKGSGTAQTTAQLTLNISATAYVPPVYPANPNPPKPFPVVPNSTPTSSDIDNSINGNDSINTSADSGMVEIKGDTTIVTVSQDMLNEQLETSKNSVLIHVPSGTGTFIARLVVNDIEKMADKKIVLSVQSGKVTYSLPTNAIDTEAIIKQLSITDSTKAIINITITMDVDAKTKKRVDDALLKDNGMLVIPPINFTVTVTYGGKTIEVTTFSGYVKRTIEITKEEAAKITTAVVIETDGSVRHVPTNVYQKNGKWYIDIYSITNSTYALINHEKKFKDIKGKWYESGVQEMANRKIINGITETIFEGDSNLTRAQFCAMVVRALGLPEKGNTSSFKDVSKSAWYYGAVSTAYKYGIVNGRSDTTFDPGSNITWQEAMVMVQRASKLVGYVGYSGNIASYKDNKQISDWAVNAAKFIVGSGLLSSNNDGVNLNPQTAITRAETADMLLKLLRKSKLIDVR